MDDDGSMARLPRLREIARQSGILLVSIADLIAYRRRHEKLVRREAEVSLPTRVRSVPPGGLQHASSTSRPPGARQGRRRARRDRAGARALRVPDRRLFHSLAATAASRWKRRSPPSRRAARACSSTCGRKAAASAWSTSSGLRAAGPGSDTVEANRQLGFADDLRDYGLGAQILARPGRLEDGAGDQQPAQDRRARWATDSRSSRRVPLEMTPNSRNVGYLQTKKRKLGHLLERV